MFILQYRNGQMNIMRALLLTMGSVVLTVGVVTNAYIQKKQFYPSVVYITKSSPSMAVLYLQAFVLVVLLGKFLRKVFFGQLRAAEMEHLIERSWYAVTETCLAFTVFRDDFSPRFVALFTMLLFLKCFHWLAEDRIDYMERSPVISILFHLRAVSLMALLFFLDAYFINHAYHNTLIKGPSVQLVFGFEYAILMTAVILVFVKYVLHTVDLQSENPWENKAVYLLYTELFLGGLKVALYFLFLAIMIKVHTFPLFAIRPMYLTVREFRKALSDVVMSRRAIRNMNTLYPDATPEEIASGDNVCIICREEMHTQCKKLPCNHIFHTPCLRSWFQRQQTCPTCRMDVLRPPGVGTAQPAAANQQQQPPVAQPFGQMLPPFAAAAFPPAAFPHVWQPPIPPQVQQPAGVATPTTSVAVTTPNYAPFAGLPQFTMPPPFGMPFWGPPQMPVPPPNFAGMTIEELRAMEGNERRAVEARIQCLRDIQTLLNAAMLQLHQYDNVVGAVSGQPAAGAFNRPPHSGGFQPGGSAPTVGSTSMSSETTTTNVLRLPRPASTAAAAADSTSAASKDLFPDVSSDAMGATGYTPLSEDKIPVWEDLDSSVADDDSELGEIRRRRIQRFSSKDLKSMDEL